ncbi:hypothetical protein MARU1_002221 [Malassezia arunalokei]|uniref:Uncharacterized protein n=1 Tax=Malassezia arunalokei TaxID=1514897 RepID=A0AAJ5YZM9_9BASI|nr:hypothetical protein MARU1_002221 [Malassezia arunalokei]
MLSSSAHRMNDSSSSNTVPFEEKPSSEQRGDKNSDASRADLWNQMLNTIIIDSPEKTSFKVDGTAVPQSRFGDSFPSNMNKRTGPQPLSGMLDQLDAEFRDRPTFGLPAPSTPTTGRSVAMSTSLNHTSAVLYRQLSRILSRNNVRRELKLNERYEKPNQMRRRKRSERHRRRFADMVRKKVQLPSEPLPEDTTPAMWQRVAQLVAGTVATGSFAYFVLLGDFGEGDHCFVPIRQALNVDAPAWRANDA